MEPTIISKSAFWCESDKHFRYEAFVDFNDWLDNEEGQSIREKFGISSLTNPSKAFFAGDSVGYDQAFREYRESRIDETLNKTYLCNQFNDDHWFQRNCVRFEQLIQRLKDGAVVPFLGAGISVEGGFPTWKNHLKQQGRTAGINPSHLNSLLQNGLYETVIQEIEDQRGREVFIQEIRDAFFKTGKLTSKVILLSELFSDTIITTNYDRLMEKAFDSGKENAFQIISGTNPLEEPASDRVTIIKLHGDINVPARCIISKNQYDQAYGVGCLDLSLPIPKLLSYYFKNSSLLFLGCSLNNDRTMQVFQALNSQLRDEIRPQHFAIQQAPETEEELSDRNEYLLKSGITAIWFEEGCFDYVENMLRLAKSELNYSGFFTE
jgi:NAD-dependent SIR2 family protein deacetylase